MIVFSGYIQACRGLMIAAVCLGFFGSIFALVGMKCTKVGGSDQTKAKVACVAGLIFILSGKCYIINRVLYSLPRYTYSSTIRCRVAEVTAEQSSNWLSTACGALHQWPFGEPFSLFVARPCCSTGTSKAAARAGRDDTGWGREKGGRKAVGEVR